MLVDFKDAVAATVALASMKNYRLDLDEESSMLLRPVYGQPPVAPQVTPNQQYAVTADQRTGNGGVIQHAGPPLGLGQGQAMDLSSFSHATAETDDMQVESPTPLVLRSSLNQLPAGPFSGGPGDGRQVNMQQPVMQHQQQRPEAQYTALHDRPVQPSMTRPQEDDRPEMHGMQNGRVLVNSTQMGPPSSNHMFAQNPQQFGSLPPHIRPATSGGGQLLQHLHLPEQQVHVNGAPHQLQSGSARQPEAPQQATYSRQEPHLQPTLQQNTGGLTASDAHAHQEQEMRPSAFQLHDPRATQPQLHTGQFSQIQNHPQSTAQVSMNNQYDPRAGPPAYDPRGGPPTQTNDPRLGLSGPLMDPRQAQYEHQQYEQQQQRGQPPPQLYDSHTLSQLPIQTQQPDNGSQGRYAAQPPLDMQKGKDGPWGPPVQATSTGQPLAHPQDAGPAAQRRFVSESAPYRSPPDRGAVMGAAHATERDERGGAPRAVGARYNAEPPPQGGGGSGGARRQPDPAQRRGSSREPVGRGGGGAPESRDDKSKRQRNGQSPPRGGRDESSRSRGAPRDRSRDSRAPSRNGLK